jgi:hypothetical protein
MSGLPHFLNARASTKLYEPVYQNLYEVSIIPPATIAGGELLLEHVMKVGGLDTDRGSDVIEQKYKFATRSYASGVPTSTVVDLTVSFSLNLNDANQMYVYKTIRDWARLIYNPLTGEQGLKKDYVGKVVVVNHNRKGEIFWQRTFHAAFPTGDIPAFDLDYGAGEKLEMADVKFRADHWQENII